eukprot:527355_1
MINVSRFPSLDMNSTEQYNTQMKQYQCKYKWFVQQHESLIPYDTISSKQIELAFNNKQQFVVLNKSGHFKAPKYKNLYHIQFDYRFVPAKAIQIKHIGWKQSIKSNIMYQQRTQSITYTSFTESESDSDIEALYETCTDTTNIVPSMSSTATGNHLDNVISNIYKKHAWFNDETLIKKYESVDSSIILALCLTDLNHNIFVQQYEYYTGKYKDSCHWLIPNVLLVGADPSGFVQYLVNDGFNVFLSLHEWENDYKDEIETCCKDMNDIELSTFPINDFGIVSDRNTVMFIDELVHKMVTMNSKRDNVMDDDEQKSTAQQHKVYMHCLGGHGRTGLIGCLLLQAIYGMDSDTAIKFINEIHLVRHPYCESDRMPESTKQRKQIRQLHWDMLQIHDKYMQDKEIDCV